MRDWLLASLMEGLLALALAVGITTGVMLGSSGLAQAAGPGLDTVRQGQLERLLVQDCGSCHGLRLLGGLGPPLLPGNLRGKSPEFLLATILDGRVGTAMPPWRPLLTPEDAAWLVQRLIQGPSTPFQSPPPKVASP